MIKTNIRFIPKACFVQIRYIRYRSTPLKNINSTSDHSTNSLKEKPNVYTKNRNTDENLLKSIEFEECDVGDRIDDGFLDYLSSKNSGFKKSNSNFNALKKQLKSLPSNSDENLTVLFDYLLKESRDEINRLNLMSRDALKSVFMAHKVTELTSKKNQPHSDKHLEDLVFKEFLYVSSEKEFSPLSNTNQMLHLLMKINQLKVGKGEVLSVEQMVESFELTKLIPDTKYRLYGMLLAGKLLYSLKTVRMDPVNESFYIDSLIFYGFFRQAMQLFESYKPKVCQRWWYEVGMTIMLRANYLQKFNILLDETMQIFGKDYIRPKVLNIAIKKKLQARDFNGANRLSGIYLQIIEKNGFNISESYNKNTKMMNFENEDHANKYLNEIGPIDANEFISIINSHLYRKNFDMGYKLLAKYIELSLQNKKHWKECIMKLQLLWLKDFTGLKKYIEPYLTTELSKQKLNEFEKIFYEVTNECSFKSIRNTFHHLLIDDLVSLSSNSNLIKLIQQYVIENCITGDTESNGETKYTNPSRNFYGIIKILLNEKRENDAFVILDKMEQCHTYSTQNMNNSKELSYPETNAHHYALFIEYYTSKLIGANKNKHICMNERIQDILKRMSAYKVPYNSVFLSQLLQFYIKTSDFTSIFSIINPLLESRMEISKKTNDLTLSSFYERRIITKRLYKDIWVAYKHYHRVFTRDWSLLSKTSNWIAWKSKVLTIRKNTKVNPLFDLKTLFKTMIHEDNILPDQSFYEIIIQTFICSREWTSLPAILKYMKEYHGFILSEKTKSYIDKALIREYISLERYKLQSAVVGIKSLSLANNAKRIVLGMLENGKILRENRENTCNTDISISYIMEFLCKDNNKSITDVKNTFDFLELNSESIDSSIATQIKANVH